MKFGLFLSYQRHHPEQDSTSLYRDMHELAVAADANGFHRIWFPEHHLIHFLQAPSSLLTAVHASQHVRCRVGTAVVVLPYHHPLIAAGEIAAADHLTGGRLDVGVARGAYRYEFDIFEQDFAKSRAQFEESLDIIQAALTSDQALTHHGEHFNFEHASVYPRPLQTPHPPLWVGGQSTGTVEWAVRRRHNVLHALFVWPLQHAAKIADCFHATRKEEGIPDGELKLGMSRMTLVVDDERKIDKHIDEALHNWRIHRALHDYTQNVDDRGYVAPVQDDADPSREETAANLMIGTLDDVAAKVAAYEAIGVDELNLWMTFGPQQEEILRSIELFGKIIRKYSDAETRQAVGAQR